MPEKKHVNFGSEFGSQLDQLLENLFSHTSYLESRVKQVEHLINHLKSILDKLQNIDFEKIQRFLEEDIATKYDTERLEDDINHLSEVVTSNSRRQSMLKREVEELQAAIGTMMLTDQDVQEALETIDKLKNIFGETHVKTPNKKEKDNDFPF